MQPAEDGTLAFYTKDVYRNPVQNSGTAKIGAPLYNPDSYGRLFVIMANLSLGTIDAEHTVVHLAGHDVINWSPTTHFHPLPDHEHPRCINNAPIGRLSAHFIGRENELCLLQEMFRRMGSGKPSCCAIYGMPGVGKSQLSLHYAKTSFDLGQYSHIFWISGDSVEKFHQGFTKILDLFGHHDRSVQDQDSKLTAVRMCLEEPYGDGGADWLVVFDNVDESVLDLLRTHLPRRYERGNILFTTRTVDVAEALVAAAGHNHSPLRLEVPGLRDAATLLLSDAGINPDSATSFELSHAEQLVQCVGCLPLAVVQAASFMKKTRTTLHQMLEWYKSERKIEVIQWEDKQSMHEDRSVAVTFARQLNLLNEESHDIGNLLKLLSFFDPENIPVDMIVDGATEWMRDELESIPSPSRSTVFQKIKKWGQRRKSRGNMKHETEDIKIACHLSRELHSLVALILAPIQLCSAIQSLQNLSLVEHRAENGKSSLWVHDLVQFMVQQDAMKQKTYRDWLHLSIWLVCGAFRHIEDPELPKCWVECEKFMPHLRSLNKRLNAGHGTNLDLIHAIEAMARYLRGRGRYGEAEAFFKQVLGCYETDLGPEDSTTLLLMNDLALVYHAQGRYSEAKDLLKRVVAISKNRGTGRLDLHLLTPLNNLASVYNSQGLYGEAEKLYKRVLAVSEKYLGTVHPSTLNSMNNLALVHHTRGRYSEAEQLYHQVLAVREHGLGANHPDTLLSMSNLASIYDSEGRYHDAQELHKQVLTASEKYLGADHPFTVLSTNNLAIVYQEQGRYREAEKLHRRVLKATEQDLGTNHPSTLLTMNNLATNYYLQRRYDDAERLLEQVHTLSKNHLGADHPNTLKSINNLALVYQARGRYHDAEELLKQALAADERQLGTDHPDTLTLMSNLASAFDSQGRYNEAEELYERALAISEDHLGDDHPSTLDLMNHLALVYAALGWYVKAKELLKRVIEAAENHLGVDHGALHTSIGNLAFIYHLQGRSGEAEKYYNRALDISEKDRGADHPDTLGLMHKLAFVYESQGRYGEAEELHQRALTGRGVLGG